MTITTMVMSVCLPGIFNFDAHHLRGADFLFFLSISFLSPSSSDGHALWPIPALHPQFLYIFCLSLSLFFSVCLSVSLALSVCPSLSLSLSPPPFLSLTVNRSKTKHLQPEVVEVVSVRRQRQAEGAVTVFVHPLGRGRYHPVRHPLLGRQARACTCSSGHVASVHLFRPGGGAVGPEGGWDQGQACGLPVQRTEGPVAPKGAGGHGVCVVGGGQDLGMALAHHPHRLVLV